MTATITLNTHEFGPTGFAVEVSPEGEVLSVSSAAAQLPEMVFRITYGDRWEYAREHFQHLAENLSYRVEAAVWLNDVLPEYKLLRRAFRKAYPDARPATGPEAPPYARRANFWLAYPEARPGLFLQKKAYSGFAAILAMLRRGEIDGEILEPWLFSLLSLLSEPADRSQVYLLLSALGTASAAEFLFTELERPGRHPYSTGLLNALRELAGPNNTQRILGLYPSFSGDQDQLRNYLEVLKQLRGAEVHQVIVTILHRYPALADAAYYALISTGHPAPGAVIREKFDQEEGLHFFDLIAELIGGEAEGIRVNLADMNAKVDHPALNAAAPVTWPQALGPYWAELVRAADSETLLGLVGEYLDREEPWLQRCALLQLNVWIRAQDSPPAVPSALENRLRQLLSSRHEKVYTVVLNVLERIFERLSAKDLTTDLVLKHARTSGYRLMNAAVLKKAARDPQLKAQQIVRMRTAIFRASTEELSVLKALVPYLRFLERKELFQQLIRERQQVLGDK